MGWIPIKKKKKEVCRFKKWVWWKQGKWCFWGGLIPKCTLCKKLLLTLNLTRMILQTGAGSGLLISMLENLNWFRLTSLITLVLLMWKWMGLFTRKNHLLRCWGWLSKLAWGSYIISIAKTVSKEIGALIRSMKFLSLELALYLYKSTMQPYMEYCCHIRNGAPRC